MMKTVTIVVLALSLGVAIGFAWSGLIAANSYAPELMEHYWAFGFIAFCVAFCASLALGLAPMGESRSSVGYRPTR